MTTPPDDDLDDVDREALSRAMEIIGVKPEIGRSWREMAENAAARADTRTESWTA
jgi:hypothetical protein